MPNWAIAGLVIALLPESAIGAAYKSVQEVCLFSPTVPPADSALAIRSLGTDYDFVREFKTGLAPDAFSGGAIAMIAPGTVSLKGIYEPLWYPDAGSKTGKIDGARDFESGTNGTANDVKTKFRFSAIPSAGIESNGFVAGFDMKY